MNKNNKMLFLVNENNYNTKLLNKAPVDIAYIYYERKQSILKRLFSLWLYCNMPYFEVWFDFKKINIKSYNVIVLYECKYPDKVISYLRKRNKDVRIIYWLWNTVAKSGYHDERYFKKLLKLRSNKKYNFQIFSFDKMDCDKYHIKYNNQVSYKINFDDKIKIEYDYFFCGRDKNRYETLQYLKKNQPNKHFKFLVVPDKNAKYIYDKCDLIDKDIPYNEMIKYVYSAKCIVDIVQNEQGGITWRPLEAIFYKKKLITNFKDIKTYDFYNSNNIFILGEDDINSLDEFLDLPYRNISNSIINKYLVNGWIKNFNDL